MDNYSELQSILQAIRKNAESLTNIRKTASAASYEIQRIMDLSIRAQKSLPDIKSLQTTLDSVGPYLDLVKRISNSIGPALIALSQVSARLSVIDRIGKLQYVAWCNFSKEFYDEAVLTNSNAELLELLYSYLRQESFKSIDELIANLYSNENLKGNRVFDQAINEYRSGEYDLSALGITAMIDRLLSEYSGMIKTVSISRRVEKIKEKIDEIGESFFDEIDINDYILICTYANAIEYFGIRVDFDDTEPELNRHWIAHGRMNRAMTQMDCIRLLTILEGTILMSQVVD